MHSKRCSLGVSPAGAADGGAVGSVAAIGSRTARAAATASPSAGRKLRSRASIRATSSSSSGGTPVRSSLSRGASVQAILAKMARGLASANGPPPVRHSNSTHPSANTSARASMSGWQLTCSGAMYPGVLIATPVPGHRVHHCVPTRDAEVENLLPSLDIAIAQEHVCGSHIAMHHFLAGGPPRSASATCRAKRRFPRASAVDAADAREDPRRPTTPSPGRRVYLGAFHARRNERFVNAAAVQARAPRASGDCETWAHCRAEP